MTEFLSRIFARSKKTLTQPEVCALIEDARRGLELKFIHEVQSIVNRNDARAIAAILEQLAPIADAAMQIDSLILIKTTDASGRSQVQVRTLTQKEMVLLENKPNLLRNPSELLSTLVRADELPMIDDRVIASN